MIGSMFHPSMPAVAVPGSSLRSVGRPAVLLCALMLFLPADVGAQRVGIPGTANEDIGREAVFQLGFGLAFPLAHLAATDDPLIWDGDRNITHRGDGYARMSTNLALRVYVPLGRRIDLAADLTLPRFGVNEGSFRTDSSIHIGEAVYYGRMLGLGGRWIPWERDWGRAFILVTAGMYQLNYQRFLGGIETITRGAYRPGASVGGGVEYTAWLLAMDLTMRYHRYTDYPNFGAGDLAWIEAGFQVSFDLDGKR